uniref:Conotoxin Vx2 n=1 Tax=Conus vexillum TaxID=89431 RepID=C2_CONVX|nr:RecName: Full=Conotoxin Vx2; Flags: Precursor [Conus vexillum]AAN78279.1 conotoxin Vx-II precursor [Conus vexillum]
MMSKLGVLVTICLLLFPLTALPLDGDQPADHPAKRTQDHNLASPISAWIDPSHYCCCGGGCTDDCVNC